jgi:hypothetical protein
MTKLPDLGAYYVDISNSEKHHPTCIILDEQGKEITHQLYPSAQVTILEMMEYMGLAERLLKENTD